jgi:hypothetical protein
MHLRQASMRDFGSPGPDIAKGLSGLRVTQHAYGPGGSVTAPFPSAGSTATKISDNRSSDPWRATSIGAFESRFRKQHRDAASWVEYFGQPHRRAWREAIALKGATMTDAKQPSALDRRMAQLIEQDAARKATIRRSPPPPPGYTAVQLREFYLNTVGSPGDGRDPPTPSKGNL